MFKYNICLLLLGILTVVSSSSCGDKEDPMDTDALTLQIDDVGLLEQNDGFVFTFTVTTSKIATEEVSFSFETIGETAEPGVDFEPVSASASIAAGQQTATIDVTILSDEIREQDETFIVKLKNATGATLKDDTGIGTIRNDDTFIDKGDDGYETPDSYYGYNPIWTDEFNDAAINTEIWTHELGNSGWGNNELQNYTADSKNSFIEDGNLVIEAIQEDNGLYSSARMITKDKEEFKFGRIDIRAKLPEGQGIWPAIWMLGSNIDETSWPACGELDIMELVGHEPNNIHGTAHWGNVGEPSQFRGKTTTDFDGYQDSYHVFSLVWTTSKVEWLVDEEVVYTVTPQTTAGYNYPYNQPFFMILNVAVGGNWPGYPDDTTVFPQRMTIDYVRAFQRT